jgi:hypothetical protein
MAPRIFHNFILFLFLFVLKLCGSGARNITQEFYNI